MKILAETGGHITVLAHRAFDKEARLQDLLERYPGLVLAGTSDDEGRVIWTIGREVGVPSGSIDLLLLDSTGHLWVVEAKLAKNAEVRKQVVGQVLAYASDVATWDREKLEQVADTYLGCREEPKSLQELLAAGEGEEEAEELIDRAVERLGRGDLTALIVVDELNSVLRRLVEFVNSNARFNVLALKLETVSHAGSRLFVPTVVGETTRHADGEETPDELLEAAPESVQNLGGQLDVLAANHGWVVSASRRSRRYRLPNGDDLIRFYPKWASITLDIGRLRHHGLDEEADHIQALIAAITGRPQGSAKPAFGAETLLANWERFTGEVLPLYVQALAEYRERKDRGE